MKRKWVSLLFVGLLVAGLCVSTGFSQFEDTGNATESMFAPTPSPASSGLGIGDNTAPRTWIYNSVMQNNLAADFTVADYLVRPHLIGDQQYIAGYHGQGGLLDGTFAFRASDLNWFGSASSFSRVGPAGAGTLVQRIQAGIGVGETFGAGIHYELNSQKIDQPAPVATADLGKKKTVFMGDAYGIFGSLSIGFASIYGNVRRETGTPITNLPFIKSEPKTPTTGGATKAPEYKQKSSQTILMVGLIKDTEMEGDHAFGIQLDFASGGSEDDRSTQIIEDSFSSLALTLSHGIPFKLSKDFAVFAGGALTVNRLSFETKLNPFPTVFLGKQSILNLNLSPNIGFRKILGKGFEGSMGISADLFNYNINNQTPKDQEETSTTATSTNFANGGNLSLGLRWVRENFSIEGLMNSPVLYQGPDFISGAGTNTAASNIFTAVGITVGF